jgi:hypothetical protein
VVLWQTFINTLKTSYVKMHQEKQIRYNPDIGLLLIGRKGLELFKAKVSYHADMAVDPSLATELGSVGNTVSRVLKIECPYEQAPNRPAFGRPDGSNEEEQDASLVNHSSDYVHSWLTSGPMPYGDTVWDPLAKEHVPFHPETFSDVRVARQGRTVFVVMPDRYEFDGVYRLEASRDEHSRTVVRSVRQG